MTLSKVVFKPDMGNLLHSKIAAIFSLGALLCFYQRVYIGGFIFLALAITHWWLAWKKSRTRASQPVPDNKFLDIENNKSIEINTIALWPESIKERPPAQTRYDDSESQY